MGHCAIYEDELQHTWPMDEKDRKRKIERFANLYGFHLSFYRQGLCAIFIKESPEVWKKSRARRLKLCNRYVGASGNQRGAQRVYDEAGNVIETHEHDADFKEP